MTTLEEIFRRAIDAIEAGRIPYLVFGGLALPAWGAIVTTSDVDLLVQVEPEKASDVVSALREAGFSLPARAETTFPIDTWTCASMGGREVDVSLGLTDFDTSAFARAVKVKLFDRDVPIASAEDLILYKLIAHRRKDLAHVEEIIARQGSKLDLAYLKDWADRIAEGTGKHEIPGVLRAMLAEQGL